MDSLKLWYSEVCKTPEGGAGSDATPTEAASSTLPYAVRHELLREFLRFIGCAILAAPAVLHPSEVQESAGIAGAMRRLASVSPSIDRLRRRDVDPLLHLLNAQVDSLPRIAGAGNTPSALELLRAEVCNLLAALLDYECSHVNTPTAEMLVQCAGPDVGRSVAPALPDIPIGDIGQVSSLVAHSSSTWQILPLLDAGSKNSFVSLVLFGILPQVRLFT